MGSEVNTAHGQPREDEEPAIYEFSPDGATGFVWFLYKHGVRFGEVYNESAARKICAALNSTDN
jgi:hypothetical protein